jgi:hypothetical protein
MKGVRSSLGGEVAITSRSMLIGRSDISPAERLRCPHQNATL